ncbi:MAG: hypothetical protein Q9184_000630 [Pyrenodesmia sp. 2 TL-2023]
MCLFKIDPKHAPLEPPGAAPTLVTLEEHYKANLMGELGEDHESKRALDQHNPTNNSIALSLDVNEKLEPNRPVIHGQPAAAGKRKMSLPLGTKIMKKANDKSKS